MSVYARDREYMSFHQESGPAYVLQMGQVPIRVQRDKARPKPLLPSEERAFREMEQMSLFGSAEAELATLWRLRLEFEAHGTGDLASLWLRLREPDNTLIAEWQLYDAAENEEGDDVERVSELAKSPPAELPPPNADFLDEVEGDEDDADAADQGES